MTRQPTKLRRAGASILDRLIDADPEHILEYVAHGLRLVRVGGTVLIPRALQNGRVAEVDDPELLERIDTGLEVRSGRAARRADRARPVPRAWPV